MRESHLVVGSSVGFADGLFDGRVVGLKDGDVVGLKWQRGEGNCKGETD